MIPSTKEEPTGNNLVGSLSIGIQPTRFATDSQITGQVQKVTSPTMVAVAERNGETTGVHVERNNISSERNEETIKETKVIAAKVIELSDDE